MIRLARGRSAATTVTFALPVDVGPVSVVGDFNGWTPGAHPLVKRSNGTRSVAVELAPGRFEFRYLADGGVWLDEPTAPEHAGDNSIVIVPAA